MFLNSLFIHILKFVIEKNAFSSGAYRAGNVKKPNFYVFVSAYEKGAIWQFLIASFLAPWVIIL